MVADNIGIRITESIEESRTLIHIDLNCVGKSDRKYHVCFNTDQIKNLFKLGCAAEWSTALGNKGWVSVTFSDDI